jgi:hypothetical protein
MIPSSYRFAEGHRGEISDGSERRAEGGAGNASIPEPLTVVWGDLKAHHLAHRTFANAESLLGVCPKISFDFSWSCNSSYP